MTARGGPRGLQNYSDIGVPPYYFGTNCFHSVGAPCTPDGRCPTNFPSGPSMAATFDRDIIRGAADIVGRELRALYNLGVAKGLDCWGPVINLNRDPRWGRKGRRQTCRLCSFMHVFARSVVRSFVRTPVCLFISFVWSFVCSFTHSGLKTWEPNAVDASTVDASMCQGVDASMRRRRPPIA